MTVSGVMVSFCVGKGLPFFTPQCLPLEVGPI